jgi:DNA-binding NarL/FixJ family response regulator
LQAISNAIGRSRTALGEEAEMRSLRDHYASLSRREREVMALVVSGLLNKQVGGELGISEITVKAHRGRVMRKMQAESLADLVKMAAGLQLTTGQKRAERTAGTARNVANRHPEEGSATRDLLHKHPAPVE